MPNTAVVSVIDLELDDAIHVGTQGQKRAGQRLARIAERELFGQVGATTPTLDQVSRGPHNTLIVKFKGVNMRAGMGGMGMGRMGAMGGGMGGSRWMGGGMGGRGSAMAMGMGMAQSLGEPSGLGLRPERHIGGFSIRKEDGTPIALIFEAAVGKARDTVVLKLTGPIPPKSFLWYGHGYDPYCNLTDSADMAVPVFGPIALDEVAELKAPAVAVAASPVPPPPSGSEPGDRQPRARPSFGADQAADHHRRSRTRLEGDDPGAERDPLAGRRRSPLMSRPRRPGT